MTQLKKKNKYNKSKKKIYNKLKGGLKLKNQNMDCNSPFHPIWNKQYINGPFVGRHGDNTYTFLQDGINLKLAGGKQKLKKKKNNNIKSIKNKKKKKKYKKLKGGLKLKNQNMDCSSPFHPIWNKQYINGPFVGRHGDNNYTFLQDGINLKLAGGNQKLTKKNIKSIKKKKKKGGLKLKNQNMDCSSPFHPIWNNQYPNGPFIAREGVNTYTFLQDGINLNSK